MPGDQDNCGQSKRSDVGKTTPGSQEEEVAHWGSWADVAKHRMENGECRRTSGFIDILGPSSKSKQVRAKEEESGFEGKEGQARKRRTSNKPDTPSKAAPTRNEHEESDESEGEDDQEEAPDPDPGVTVDALRLAESSRCFRQHIYYSLLTKLSRRQLMCRKDPDVAGFMYQKIDGKANEHKKYYVVAPAVIDLAGRQQHFHQLRAWTLAHPCASYVEHPNGHH